MTRRGSSAKRALLILDMISRFEFADARPVLLAARRIAPAIARLKARAAAHRVPVIYVNDMAGRWESEPQEFVSRCRRADAAGRDIAQRLAPTPSDFFIFKPRHSAFFATALAELLERLAVREVVLTGLTSHQCVLFTGMDAYVREYQVVVPQDCIAAPSRQHTKHALFVLRNAVMARTPLSTSLRLYQ